MERNLLRGLTIVALLAPAFGHASVPGDTIFVDAFDPPCAIITTSRITYGISNTPDRPLQDVRQWSAIWGAASATGNVQNWPGPNAASPVIRDFARHGCVAAEFHVPAGFPSTKFGQFVHAINPAGPPIDASYSLRPGDFSDALGTGCSIQNWPDNLSAGLAWKINSTNPNFCGLRPDTTYYLNIRLTDPEEQFLCIGGSTCIVYLQHTHN